MTPEPRDNIVERVEVDVMFKRVADDVAAIGRGWTELEGAIGSLRGRKFYGAFDEASAEYHVCVELRAGDDPDALGLEAGTLPGGRYARLRLRGEPPGVYEGIAPGFETLAKQVARDTSRPDLEYYRRRDVVDLLLPVK